MDGLKFIVEAHIKPFIIIPKDKFMLESLH